MVSANFGKYLLTPVDGSLNPYYTGRWFLLQKQKVQQDEYDGLNPYYTGRWFLLK